MGSSWCSEKSSLPLSLDGAMSVAFVSNQQRGRDYEPLERKYPTTFVTVGAELNVEFIVRALAHSTPQDFLVLDGSPIISSICLAIWLEQHGECNILSIIGRNESWYSNRVSRTSLRRMIAVTQDQEQSHGRR